MNPILSRRHALVLAGSSAIAPAAFAQGVFPDRAVNMIVPFAPGGTPDIAARLMAPKMGELLGQPVTVETALAPGPPSAPARSCRRDPMGIRF